MAILPLSADSAVDINISDVFELAGWAILMDIEPLANALSVVLVVASQPDSYYCLQAYDALIFNRVPLLSLYYFPVAVGQGLLLEGRGLV